MLSRASRGTKIEYYNVRNRKNATYDSQTDEILLLAQEYRALVPYFHCPVFLVTRITSFPQYTQVLLSQKLFRPFHFLKPRRILNRQTEKQDDRFTF